MIYVRGSADQLLTVHALAKDFMTDSWLLILQHGTVLPAQIPNVHNAKISMKTLAMSAWGVQEVEQTAHAL